MFLMKTDDTARLRDEEIVRIYGIRWQIETFFKVTKSYLQLGVGTSVYQIHNVTLELQTCPITRQICFVMRI
jgi:hypothetical protein